jgi:hypothetical protein
MFYPAILMGQFEDGRSALESVGITGHIADMWLAGFSKATSAPIAYRTTLFDEYKSLTTVLVLDPRDRESVRLCCGFVNLASDTEQAALINLSAHLVDDVLAGEIDPPTAFAYPLQSAKVTLQ